MPRIVWESNILLWYSIVYWRIEILIFKGKEDENMITTEVTSEQIENWKKIYSENKNNLVVNRISGKELNDYFVEKYHPTKEAPSQFVDTVILNTKENGKQEPIISAYILAGNIYVGIDLNTGFFQVECEDIDKMKIIWDDLFIVRGLSEEDIVWFW